MLIFDDFLNRKAAEAFVKEVQSQFGHKGEVFDSQDDSNKVDPFPFELTPPIALVDRAETMQEEARIIDLVVDFGGAFAGT